MNNDILEQRRRSIGRSSFGLAGLAWWRVGLGITLAVLFSWNAHAEQTLRAEHVISPTQAIEMAREHALSLRAAELRRGKALRRSKKAGLVFLPRFDLSGSYTHLSDVELPAFPGAEGEEGFSFPVILDNYSASLNVALPLSDYLVNFPHLVKVTRLSDDIERLQLVQQKEQLAATSLQSYLEVLASRRALEIAKKAAKLLKAQAEDIQVLADAGNVTSADAAAVTAQAAQLEAEVIRAQSRNMVAEARFRQLHGIDTASALQLDTSIEAWQRPFDILPEEPIASIIDKASQKRGDLQALKALTKLHHHQGRRHLAGQLPKLVIGGDITSANPNQRIIPAVQEYRTTWAVYAALSWSPNDFISEGTKKYESKLDHLAATADLRAMEQSVELQLIQARDEVLASSKSLAAAKKQAKAAAMAFENQQVLSSLGDGTVTELLEREQAHRQAQLGLLNAQIQDHLSRVRWLLATGELLEKYLSRES